MDAQPLKGKIAIVTGGSRGIGTEIAKELARRGASVALTYVSSAEKANAVVRDIEKTRGQACAIQADSGDPSSSTKVVEETVKKFGDRIDIIVNNAACGDNPGYLDDTTVDYFDKMMRTNVLGPLLLIKESQKYLSNGGRIVNISSTAARRPMPYNILYAASKVALESVTRSLAMFFGESHGITVNAVNPGPVDTDMWTPRERNPEVEGRITAQTCAGRRIGKPHEIAVIVAFLCDPSTTWVTANVICGNGGLVLL